MSDSQSDSLDLGLVEDEASLAARGFWKPHLPKHALELIAEVNRLRAELADVKPCVDLVHRIAGYSTGPEHDDSEMLDDIIRRARQARSGNSSTASNSSAADAQEAREPTEETWDHSAIHVSVSPVTLARPHPFHNKPSGDCENCGKRPATEWWIGERSSLDVARSGYADMWCAICCLDAQIDAAEKRESVESMRTKRDTLLFAESLSSVAGLRTGSEE